MLSSSFTRAAVAAGLLASTVSAAFDASSNKNVVMYWGQGSNQIPLSDVCNDESIDIVVIGFVYNFPRNVGDYPTTNFGNACWDTYYPDPYDPDKLSKVNHDCPSIPPGIQQCQANGKKVLLSLGGDSADEYLKDKAVTEYFAHWLWNSFGPVNQTWIEEGKPRPFRDAVVDGFDLDIESELGTPGPFTNYKSANYAHLVNTLRKKIKLEPKPYYIAGAPQCKVPDSHLADAIKNSKFDFVFVQFYNTPACSARVGYNDITAKTPTWTYNAWATWLSTYSNNKSVKLYIGLPAGVDGVGKHDPTSYITPQEASWMLPYYARRNTASFGGVMLWEATVSVRNSFCGKPYGSYIKDILMGRYTAPPKSCSSTIKTSSSSSTKPTSSSIKPVSTTKKSTSSAKPTSTAKPASTTKKATSTTKKATSTTKKATSTTKKATSTTKKATSTTKKATSTTKKATSTTKKATSSTKKATSSTKRASSSIKRRDLPSTSDHPVGSTTCTSALPSATEEPLSTYPPILPTATVTASSKEDSYPTAGDYSSAVVSPSDALSYSSCTGSTATLTKFIDYPTASYQTPTGETYKPEQPHHQPEEGESTTRHTSTTHNVITLTKVPAPSAPSGSPYAPAQSTGVYGSGAPAPSGGAASSTGGQYGAYPSDTPIEFEGGANRMCVGMSGVALLVAGFLML